MAIRDWLASGIQPPERFVELELICFPSHDPRHFHAIGPVRPNAERTFVNDSPRQGVTSSSRRGVMSRADVVSVVVRPEPGVPGHQTVRVAVTTGNINGHHATIAALPET